MIRYTKDKEEYETSRQMCRDVHKIEHDGHIERCFLLDGQILDSCISCPLLVI